MKTSTEFNLSTYPRANGDMTIILDAQGSGLDYEIEYHWFRSTGNCVRCLTAHTSPPVYSEADGRWAARGFRRLMAQFIGEGC
jgi:L-lactate utilization protein LutB